MISKRVAMSDGGRSNFARLANYITSTQNKHTRIEDVSVTNCRTAQGITNRDLAVGIAANEVISTQSQNQRAVSDKTYHLLISFRAGEHPEPKVLKEIEEAFCDALGYREHQRISAVHNDTDNLHIHVAINKIHPERLTLHDPKNDYWTRDKLCASLERKYGLEPDNHVRKKSRSEGLSADMEAHTGEQSLLSWLKENVAPQLKESKKWDDVFSVLEKNGVSLKKQGNGFVFQSDGVTVKASSLGRDFSKNALQKRLGAFPNEVPVAAKKKGGVSYRRKPIDAHKERIGGLYARFIADKNNIAQERKNKLEALRSEHGKRIQKAHDRAKLKRSFLKMGRGPLAKKIAHAAIKRALNNEIKAARLEVEKQKKNLRKKPQSWADWLREEAEKGNKEALEALRFRNAAAVKSKEREAREDGVLHQGKGQTLKGEQVTKTGTVLFRTAQGCVRDDGKRITLPKQMVDRDLIFVLNETIKKQGSRLSLTGSKDFQERVVKLAARERMDITFDDEKLEKLKEKEAQHEQREETRTSRTYGTRRDRSDVWGGGRAGAASNGQGRDTEQQGKRYSGRVSFYRAISRAGEPSGKSSRRGFGAREAFGFGKFGNEAFPPGRNRMQHLSSLNVAGNTGRGEVLVPGYARNGLDDRSTRKYSNVRRTGDQQRTREQVSPQKEIVAAQKYVQERRDKRLQGYPVERHSLYRASGDEDIIYQGVRSIDGQPLILLQRKGDQEILVKPTDKKTRQRLTYVTKGATIRINQDGSVVTKRSARKKI